MAKAMTGKESAPLDLYYLGLSHGNGGYFDPLALIRICEPFHRRGYPWSSTPSGRPIP